MMVPGFRLGLVDLRPNNLGNRHFISMIVRLRIYYRQPGEGIREVG